MLAFIQKRFQISKSTIFLASLATALLTMGFLLGYIAGFIIGHGTVIKEATHSLRTCRELSQLALESVEDQLHKCMSQTQAQAQAQNQ